LIIYYLYSFSILFIILSLSQILKFFFNINNNVKYLLTVLILITSLFSVLKIINVLNLTSNLDLSYIFIFKFIFYLLLFISFINLIYNKFKIEYYDIAFITIFVLIAVLSFDRYFLDEDEFTFWGSKIKDYLFYDYFYKLNFDYYHKPFLTSWHLFFIILTGFEENILIFSNNIILICAFFFLIGENFEFKKIKKIIYLTLYFFLYYLIINNLSFGFVSIYADPIITTLVACLAKLIFLNNFDKKNIFLFLLFIISIYFIHRIGIILLILFLPYIFLKNYNYLFTYKNISILLSVFILTYFNFWFSERLNNLIICLSILHLIIYNNIFNLKIKKEHNISFLILILVLFRILFFEQLSYSATPFKIFSDFSLMIDILKLFLINLKNLFFVEIYFSSFGITYNKISELIFNKENFVPIFNLSILFWTAIICFFLLIKKNFFICGYFLLSLTVLLLFVYIEKIYLQKLSPLVIGRYISIMLIPYLIFAIFEKKKNVILYLLLIINISVTPLKSFGFIVPDKIYYSQNKNYDFLQSRESIKNFASNDNQCKFKYIVILYDKNNFPKFLNGHYSLILNIIKFEYFSSKIIYFDINEIYSLNNKNFLNKFDCIFSVNLTNKDYKYFNIFPINIKKIDL